MIRQAAGFISGASSPNARYRDTVFLPKTDFPMKAGLPQKEPGILARWQAIGLYARLREARAGREKFILHDGPPYANGDMHIGHALNHILKDMVCRTQTLLGKDAPYVPGWDCHGLPIEWKVEEEYRKKKKNKDEVPVKEFRAECRAYAQHWVDAQREQIKRLGVLGNWDKPYLTMDFEAEATIVSELLKFAERGHIYRGAKPVMWSPVEKTALAEAEVEYEDITSTQVDVAFEIVESPIAELVGAHAVIWTTTPWTIPVNQAIAYGPDVEYAVCTIQIGAGVTGDLRLDVELNHHPLSRIADRRVLVAKPLVEAVSKRLDNFAKSQKPQQEGAVLHCGLRTDFTVAGSDLAGTIARHPMAKHLRRPALDAGLGSAPDDAANSQARIKCGATIGRGWSSFSNARAPSCPAITSQPTAALAMSIWRPIMARTISICARRTASIRSSRSKATAAIAPTGRGLAGKAVSSTRSSTLSKGRSAPTCARRARSLPQARITSTVIRIAGDRRQR